MNRDKPTILLMSDSAAIDTGFGRVAREIGTALVQTGLFNVKQLGWFHQPSERLVPFSIIPTDVRQHPRDAYAQLSWPKVIDTVKPDLVLALGDEWMLRHTATRPRDFPYIGYVPIDGAPVSPKWVQTFASLDRLVMFGDFAEHALRMTTPDFPVTKIPHGVDTSKFYPLSDDQSREAKARLIGDPDLFLVGTVARNNSRKCLPRLLKAYRMFIQPWTSCGDCGNVTTQQASACNACGSTNVASGGPKTNTRLYIHSTPYDDAGHDLADLAVINRIQDYLIMPRDIQIGRGVSDSMLNRVYNAMDLFTLPTGGEGFGLPIAEAMSAGTPVLVTAYSGHVDFVNGPGEFIHVSEFNTDQCNNAERAIVDIFDYVLKLDTFYLPHEEFVRKWGAHLVMQGGWSVEQLGAFRTGAERCNDLGRRCHQHIQAWDWSTITPQWVKLICDMLNYHPEDQAADTPVVPQMQLEFV